MVFITDPAFYFVAIPAVLINGIGKGGLGSAIGVVGVPLMALVIYPIQAAAILLPLLLVMDIVAVWGYWQSINRQCLSVILPPGLLGIVLGALLISFLPDNSLRIIVGFIAVLFTLLYYLSGFWKPNTKPGKLAGRLWSIIAGFTSFSVHAGGPPISVYLLPQKMEKQMMAGTQAVYFAALNMTKVFAYSVLGAFDATYMATAALMLPVGILGVWLGMKIVQKINEVFFYRFLYAGLLVTGIKLLADGFSELF